MTENEELRELLREVVSTFETAFNHSDLLNRIRLKLNIEAPWYVKQHQKLP
jgi:hypothetical protein